MYVTFKIKKNFENLINFSDIFNNFNNYFERADILPASSSDFFETFTKYCTPTELGPLSIKYPVNDMEQKIKNFEPRIDSILQDNMSEHYEAFLIPKASGGMRQIHAPKEPLMSLLRDLKDTLETQCYMLPHNSAYAYVKHRSTVDALHKHQQNKSRWFLKIDIKDFFPNHNYDHIKKQLTDIFPIACFFRDHELMKKFINICLLNNQLPQGTPISPFLTNICMIPLDYEIYHTFKNYDQKHFVYTRYADDILISSKYHFDWKKVQDELQTILTNNSPFQIKKEKTRYGSSAGRNWNLGLMLNKDNNITIGYKRKERLRATLFSFFKDFQAGNIWSPEQVQVFLGNLAYFKKVEPEYIENLIKKYSKKFNRNFYELTNQILSP